MTTPVLDVMTRAPVTVTPQTTVVALMALFDRHDFNVFPVVDRAGTLCGIVTKLDLLRLLRPDWAFETPDARILSSACVADIIRHGVVSVEPDDPIVVTADLMVETRLRSLPVVQCKGGGPVLVGIVSQGDLLRGFRFELVDRAREAKTEAKSLNLEVLSEGAPLFRDRRDAGQALTDELEGYRGPTRCGALGTWYRHFEQTDDSEVIELLRSITEFRVNEAT